MLDIFKAEINTPTVHRVRVGETRLSNMIRGGNDF